MTAESIAVDHEARLPDGRRLAGKSFGRPDGRPVLFVAGAGTGSSMSFGGELLDEMRVRLITMDRPGMGGSDADPDRTPSSTARDYRDFVRAVLGEPVADVPVVANSQGALFGLAMAVAGWSRPCVLVSPMDEVAHPAIRSQLPPAALELPDLVRDDPARARDVLGGFSAADMEQMVVGGSSGGDRDVYAQPDFLATYRVALAEGFGGAGAGYVQDTVMAMSPWGLRLDAIDLPVHVLYGDEDRTHSPDLGETLASRIPGARREVVAGAGGALLWTHSRRVLEIALDG
ncbi:alpha/beta hydrolase [Isoptericola sp. F-RaC21]|uniref:alpha/beta fold hydrolase n=1 Tax=Isoptericola sp. F-RaC21 TaxID=3141452 RepID=UPI00315B8F0B